MAIDIALKPNSGTVIRTHSILLGLLRPREFVQSIHRDDVERASAKF